MWELQFQESFILRGVSVDIDNDRIDYLVFRFVIDHSRNFHPYSNITLVG